MTAETPQGHEDQSVDKYRAVVVAIVLLLAAYALATLAGWTLPSEAAAESHAELAEPSGVPALWAVLPFVGLLGAIAVLPLLKSSSHWWESNLHKFFVAGGAALCTLIYLAILYPQGGLSVALATFAHVLANEYFPFIVLLFGLFTISGGIRIEGDLPAHPLTNIALIASGGLLASFIGTTGAAMLLVRPLLDTNSERRHVAHTVVFFIFVACNCGGLLLPIGDPPLFLGYLSGVPFFWTFSLWKSWLFVNAALLAVYYALDHFVFYPREAKADVAKDETTVRPLKFSGLWPNALLLIGVILSVALLDPAQTIPGTSWRPWLYLREMVQLALVMVSLTAGSAGVRGANRFNFAPIVEVAVLFVGIFVAMQPALDLLDAYGASLGVDTPREFFWATGWLSSILDNAPTYMVFFEAARNVSAGTTDLVAGVHQPLLAGLSLGAVTMGAMTYIGNGPNFMVKTIAEQSGVKMPSFFGYMLYSFAILLPILALDSWLFLE
jgi:Na+/H+ antiporter NhaD/arsenite permease-like protein